MERDELAAWLRLTLTPGVGNLSARRLLTAFGLPANVFAQPIHALQTCCSAAQASALQTIPAGWASLLDTTWAWLHASDRPETPARAIVALGHPLYPPALFQTEDPPLMLYMMGPARFLQPSVSAQMRCLAMVGSRNPTPQGQENARQFANTLRGAGLTIVSGLALGIDAAAHEGALTAATEHDTTPATIAVVGTGLDRVYPRQHLDLARRIAAQGLLVSEYPLGAPPLAANFPQRNRIISGLAQGTLVVEAAPASGSLITARLASEQGREVFAIPGSIHSIQSRGCHSLIRQGAKLVELAQDVLEELPWPADVARPSETPQAAACTEAPDTECDALLTALGFDPIGMDALQARTGYDTATLQVQLLEMELAGAVSRLPGGLFQRMGCA